MESKLRYFFAAVSLLLVGGCAIQSLKPPLHHIQGDPLLVVMPMDPDTQTFTVHLGSYFVPGTFIAQLDGKDITQFWQPVKPSTSGTSKWVYLDSFQGGACATPPNVGSPKSPEKLCTHTLHVHGDAATSNPLVTDVNVNFVPVHLALLPKDSTGRYYSYGDRLQLTPGETMKVTLNADTYGPWPQDNVVLIEALDFTGRQPADYISLNGMSAGQPIHLTISGGNGADFTVRAGDPGRGTWRFHLRARAIGCQEAVYSHAVVFKP